MQQTMKQKSGVGDEESIDRFGRPKKKIQSDFMKQLTDLAQQAVEPSPPPPADLPPDETQRQVNHFDFLSLFVFLLFERRLKYHPVHLKEQVD